MMDCGSVQLLAPVLPPMARAADTAYVLLGTSPVSTIRRACEDEVPASTHVAPLSKLVCT